jgi:arsenate reductase (thioredoxin)
MQVMRCPNAAKSIRYVIYSYECPGDNDYTRISFLKSNIHMPKTLNVLFLCTHNSARSILAEALLNHLGQGKFKGFSAGSSPRANQLPNPLGLQVLRDAGIATDGLHSKSWDDFAKPNAPHMDLIITVCDNAAGETCPYWPGNPASAHWGYADPSAGDAPDEQKLIAFRHTLHALSRRIELLVNLPAAGLDQSNLESSAKKLAAA